MAKELGLEALEEISGGGAEIFNKFAGLSGAKQAAIISALAAITASAAVGATMGAKPAYRAIMGYDPTQKFTKGAEITAEAYGKLTDEQKKNKFYAKDKDGKIFEMNKDDKGMNYDQLKIDGLTMTALPTKPKEGK